MTVYSSNNVQNINTSPDLVLFDSSKPLVALQTSYPNAKFIIRGHYGGT